MKIIAPYRFVETSDKIFYPSWGNKKGEDISFDIPYRDSQSGEIEITLVAKSPIFVGEFTGKNKDSEIRDFFNHYGVYYIPGSSVKGMIRCIAAILSFSKMSLADKTLSYRDLKNEIYEKKAMQQNKVFMGWLSKKSKQWFIQEVGNITKSKSRIKYQEMEKYLGKDLVTKIRNAKEAYKKYNIVADMTKLKTKEGTIVFTGSTGSNKIREFIFPNTLFETYELTNQQIQNFKEAYYIGTPNESKDWKNLWSKKFNKEEKIPIFFQKDSNGQILHFGLSMLYKLPYENSIATLYKNSICNYDEKLLDFTERIFGYVKDTESLKGRISFSHFKAQEPKKCEPKELILSSPRPTFYPYYLKQTPNTTFKTYDDKKAKLSGFKFYVPRNSILRSTNTDNNNIKTQIVPLEKGTKFLGKVRYFNLRKEELGLLLLSLTFLKDKYFYKIGGAKPYGYGDCHLELKTDINIQEYIQAYVDFVIKEFKIDPKNSKSAEELREISQKMSDDSSLEYLDIQGFTKIKSENTKKADNKNSSNKKLYKGKNEQTYKDKGVFDSPFASLKKN